MLVGITVSLEGEANVFSSFFSFRRIRNMRRNSVMKGVSDSQLLLFRVVRRILQVTISVGKFLIYFSGDNIIRVGNENIKKRQGRFNFFFFGELDVAAYGVEM